VVVGVVVVVVVGVVVVVVGVVVVVVGVVVVVTLGVVVVVPGVVVVVLAPGAMLAATIRTSARDNFEFILASLVCVVNVYEDST